ncbi:molybdenum cofactor biosynthesis protein A [Aquisphaera giovannonii]|uniref:Molybdenum cofactor biosynthesis protein A n=1 Tax=Aquisphaera giovannonii TaxID=406548 RepID=A0A5B9VWG7_9BACT|nr:radical SAM/SPASM domain-containing protein [Aquisphaera giovannonii]QEH32404.1 molybdenum cofactor biosynthesis protein A [Aquisphaera giovannonii]
MPSHTRCDYVLRSAFIDRDGEVYACCHRAPVGYGNIASAHLLDILRRPAACAARDRSREGSLECFASCNLLDYRVKHGPPPAAVDRDPQPAIRKLTLSLGWFCNVDCVMCPQDHKERVFLDVDVLRRHVPWEIVEEIIFEGGEPLAAPQVHALWDHVASLGKPVNFCTNGLVANPSIADRIARQCDYLYISFNAATAETYERVVRKGRWRLLLRNVEMVLNARERSGSGLKLIGHFTIVEENLREIPRFLELMGSLGFDIANFGYNRMAMMGRPIDAMLDSDPSLRSQLGREIRDAIRRASPSLAVDTSRLCYLGLLDPGEPCCGRIVEPSGM